MLKHLSGIYCCLCAPWRDSPWILFLVPPLLLVTGVMGKGDHCKSSSGDTCYHNIGLRRDFWKDHLHFHLCVQTGRLFQCDNIFGAKMIFGSGTKLLIKPKTKNTPSVYKLKSSEPVENLPNSVCLITDFPSPNKTLRIDDKEVNLNDVAVLDNSLNNVWRYSAVIWDNNEDVTCDGKYDDKNFDAISDTDDTEETCSSISIDEHFQTNPSLNTKSLTVLGLRVLTAKAIIFNLIITLKLWSS